MQRVFEKIIEKLEEIRVKKTCKKEKCDTKELCRICVVDDAIEIVKHASAEYNNGWILSERLLRKIIEKFSNIYRVVENDEDLGWNRAVYKCEEIVNQMSKERGTTNFDMCCESIEAMAQIIDIAKIGWTKEQIMEWLQKEECVVPE